MKKQSELIQNYVESLERTQMSDGQQALLLTGESEDGLSGGNDDNTGCNIGVCDNKVCGGNTGSCSNTGACGTGAAAAAGFPDVFGGL